MKSPLDTESRPGRRPSVDDLNELIDAPKKTRAEKAAKQRKPADEQAALAISGSTNSRPRRSRPKRS
jgi:hypothetical protein